MAEVAFHTGVEVPLEHAHRLLRKAYRQGTRVAVVAAPAALDALSRLLWSAEPLEFLAHARITASTPRPTVQRTPIWLLAAWPAPPAPPAPVSAPEVLINLGCDLDASLAGVARLIEIVSTEADEVRTARARWRGYAAGGAAITHHPAGAAP